MQTVVIQTENDESVELDDYDGVVTHQGDRVGHLEDLRVIKDVHGLHFLRGTLIFEGSKRFTGNLRSVVEEGKLKAVEVK